MIEPPLPHLTGEKRNPQVLQVLSAVMLLFGFGLYYVASEILFLRYPFLTVASAGVLMMGAILWIASLKKEPMLPELKKEDTA